MLFRPYWETSSGWLSHRLAGSFLFSATHHKFMNPAEEIVKYWLKENGFFVQSSIRVPNGRGREIDILAVDDQGNNKRHIEVSVSIEMAHFHGNAQTRAQDYDKKFHHPKIIEEVQRRFGNHNEYRKELVVGDVAIKKENVIDKFITECRKLDIHVIPISGILEDIYPKLKAHNQLNHTVKTIQITKKFL